MKHLLKAAAAFFIVMIADIIINVLCNMHSIDLNATATSIVSTFCALAIYHLLIRNETDKKS